MKRLSKSLTAGMAFAALSATIGSGRVLADGSGALFCTREGQQVRAERFEAKDGKFYLFVAGSTQPLEYSSNAIAGINVPCTNPVRAVAMVSPQGSPAALETTGSFGVHGSNTIGERLMPMLVEAYSVKQFGKPPVVTFGEPEEQQLVLGKPGASTTTVSLHAHGSGTAAKALLDGNAQIGMASRRETDAEAKAFLAANNLDIRGVGNEHVLALDGLAVIVNPSNPVKQLTLEQIAQIFSGQATNWSQFGGANAPIVIHRRDDKSGTFDTFKALVLEPRKVAMSAQAKQHESSETLSEEVSRDANAIGFIGLPYVNRSRALTISEPCGLSSSPSKFTVKSESYPLARRLFLYTLGQPSNQVARDLLRFALSDDAQQTIQEAGYVEQSVELQGGADQSQWLRDVTSDTRGVLPGKDVPAAARSQLVSVASSARRTSLVLRFDRASANLDTRAQQDVERFARYLRSAGAQGRRFYVVGFADSDGAWATNQKLADDRAASVSRALQQAGVTVREDQQVSFSYQAPVACNDSDAGKAKNRRVEIWIAN